LIRAQLTNLSGPFTVQVIVIECWTENTLVEVANYFDILKYSMCETVVGMLDLAFETFIKHCFCTVCGACSLSNILGWNIRFQVLGPMLEPPSYSPLLHTAELINFIAIELSPTTVSHGKY